MLYIILACNLFSANISLIVTTNNNGEIDPCGWPKKPLGGLARKATVIDEIKSSGKNPIILDSGNLFYKNKQIDPGIALETAKINADVIVDSYNLIGCDAFSPGVNDFAAGYENFMSLYKKSDFDYVSCNIYYKSNNSKLLFEPYKIINRSGLKIGVVGLASIFESDGIVVSEPIEELGKIIDEVDAKTDFIILLFNSNDQDLNNLYDRNFNIDMIIKSNKGHTKSRDGGSNIPTYIAGNRGKVLYDFSLTIEDLELDLVDVAWCNNTVNRVNDRLKKMKKGDAAADLLTLYKNDPTTLNRIKNYYKQLDNAEYLLANSVNKIEFNKIELNKNIFDKPSVLKIVDEGKRRIRDLEGDLLTPYAP